VCPRTGGWGKDTIKSFPFSSIAREKIACGTSNVPATFDRDAKIARRTNTMTFKDLLKERLLHDLGFEFYVKAGAPKKTFQIISKDSGIVCGTIFIATIVKLVDEQFFLEEAIPSLPVAIKIHKSDGDVLKPKDIIATLFGNAEVILKAERTILNIISQLSGIATYTQKQIKKLSSLPVVLIDTRKGDPLFRPEYKYAVSVGGGRNHRSGFFDGIIIKDNDIAAYGGIKKAIDKYAKTVKSLTKIEIEVQTLSQLNEVLKDGRVDVILLDNMPPHMLKKAVSQIRASKKPYLIEASGIAEYGLAEIAKTGVDLISTSSLFRRAQPLDISLQAV